MRRPYNASFSILGPNLSNTVQALCVAFMDKEVKISLLRGGEGGMPHYLTDQFAVWLDSTCRRADMFYQFYC